MLSEWQAAHGPVAALGIGSFGPLDIAAGRITDTPKSGWSGTKVVEPFARLDVPLAFDTDVAGAALAEHRWGAARGTRVSAYITIGTGIGAGLIVDGNPVHGLVHPEIGHVRVTSSDGLAGNCPFHGNCLEGLASGPAIAARTGSAAHLLPTGHAIWTMIANEIGEMIAMLLLTLSPQRVVIGGGIGAGQPQLLPIIRDRVAIQLNSSVAPITRAALDGIVVSPGLGDLSGPLGAVALGNRAASPGSRTIND